jgi:hypothetical protein
VYEPSSEEKSREESDRLGARWTGRGSTGAGSGSWKRTVRFGLVVDVEVDLMDVWLEERMEAWSVLV